MSRIIHGDCLEKLKDIPENSVDSVITSPPYWALRDYGVSGQLGLEPTFQEYIDKLCDIFDEVKRVLKDEGTCWVNIGDTYGGSNGAGYPETKWKALYNGNSLREKAGRIDSVPNKSLCCIPDRFKIEMINRGWICRNEIIWFKPNCMPSSAKDRFTVDYEKVFFFVKQKNYFFKTQYEPLQSPQVNPISSKKTDAQEKAFLGNAPTNLGRCGSSEQGRNKRCVWKVATKSFKEAHFATYPEALIEPMMDAGCPVEGVVLDPFSGAGTTGVVAKKQNKKYIGIELNQEYITIAERRIKNTEVNREIF